MTDADPAILSVAERAYIPGELDAFFSTLPSVAEGFIVKVWKSGPLEGKPKVPAGAQGMIDRGLLRLDTTERFPRLFFTEPGLAALPRMMADKRFVDPAKFAHIRREFGIAL
jgi:hypothetical protein